METSLRGLWYRYGSHLLVVALDAVTHAGSSHVVVLAAWAEKERLWPLRPSRYIVDDGKKMGPRRKGQLTVGAVGH